MKKVILLFVFLGIYNFSFSQLAQSSGVTLDYSYHYYNSITSEVGCEFDQYKIVGYVKNNSGRTIKWNWGGIDFPDRKCNGANGRWENKVNNGSFNSFLTITNGSTITTTFYIQIFDDENIGGISPGWDWNWKFID